MIDLSDKLEGYEKYVTQDLNGEIYKWEYRPIISNAYSEWQADMGESDSNTWGVSFNKIHSPNWKESLIDLSTHVPYLIDGILTPIPKIRLSDKDEPLWINRTGWNFQEKGLTATDVVNKPEQDEYTGSSVSYYKVVINNPTSEGEPYTAECNDIIEALNMSYAEGNIFKAVWRRCAARNLFMKKRGYDSGLYDAEKIVFFGNRIVKEEKKK